MGADGGLIHRSVALSADTADLLDMLADAEGTSRSHLMREALTLLFRARGISADGQAGVDLNPAAVQARRRQRREPVGDRVRQAFTDWWSDCRDDVIAEHAAVSWREPVPAALFDQVVSLIADRVGRDGTWRGRPADVLVPGGWKQDRSLMAAVDHVERALVESGGLFRRRLRGTNDWLLWPAPWVESQTRKM
jgi:hypothetical protein